MARPKVKHIDWVTVRRDVRDAGYDYEIPREHAEKLHECGILTLDLTNGGYVTPTLLCGLKHMGVYRQMTPHGYYTKGT